MPLQELLWPCSLVQRALRKLSRVAPPPSRQRPARCSCGRDRGDDRLRSDKVFLVGRVTERTYAALAALVVLIGGFCLFTLFGLIGREIPAAGSLVLLGNI